MRILGSNGNGIILLGYVTWFHCHRITRTWSTTIFCLTVFWILASMYIYIYFFFNSPPARWGLLDFMSVAAPPPLLLLLLLAFCQTSTTTSHAQCLLPDLNHDQPRPVFAAGPQPRPATPSVRCRTSTTTSHAQCSHHDQPRPVFAAGPQPRPSTPSVRCRTSTTTSHAQCSLPDLNSYAKSYAR